MASPSTALISRSIQHLLRRNGAAAAPALSAVAGKSIVARPLPVNPIVQEPVSAGAAANSGFHGRALDMALFGRVDWPVMEPSERVSMIVKNSDSDDEFTGDFDPDEFDDSEDFDSDEFVDEDEEEEDFEETKLTKSKRSKNKMD